MPRTVQMLPAVKVLERWNPNQMRISNSQDKNCESATKLRRAMESFYRALLLYLRTEDVFLSIVWTLPKLTQMSYEHTRGHILWPPTSAGGEVSPLSSASWSQRWCSAEEGRVVMPAYVWAWTSVTPRLTCWWRYNDYRVTEDVASQWWEEKRESVDCFFVVLHPVCTQVEFWVSLFSI